MSFKRLVKGTNSSLDGLEAAFGPLLDFYKVDGNLKTYHGKMRQLSVITHDDSKQEVKGIFIEDGYLVNLSEDEENVFHHGKFIREYSYKTAKTILTIVEFENILQLSIQFENSGENQYKRKLYLPVIQRYFENYKEGGEKQLMNDLGLLV